jgi:hypothetical protein
VGGRNDGASLFCARSKNCPVAPDATISVSQVRTDSSVNSGMLVSLAGGAELGEKKLRHMTDCLLSLTRALEPGTEPQPGTYLPHPGPST